jgi:hypothetical protein
VKDTRVISQKKDPDGLWNVQIAAVVVSTQLKKKLESLNIATKKMDGGSLYSAAVSKAEEQKNAGELLRRVLSKYPQAAYIIDIGTPEVIPSAALYHKARMNIPLTFKWDESFLAELRDILSRVSKEKLELAYLGMYKETPITRNLREKNKIICIAKKGILKSGSADVCFAFQYKPERGAGYGLLNLPYSSDHMKLAILFKEKEGNIIEAANYSLRYEDSDSPKKQRIFLDRGDPNWLRVLTAMEGQGFVPPDILWRDLNSEYLLFVADGDFHLEVKAEISMKNLNDMASIEVRVNPWKN